MYSVRKKVPEHRYPLYPSTGIRFKKVVFETYNPYTQNLWRANSWPTPRPGTGRLLLHRAALRRTRRAGSALQRAARPGLVVDLHRDGAPRAPSLGKRRPNGADSRRSRRHSQRSFNGRRLRLGTIDGFLMTLSTAPRRLGQSEGPSDYFMRTRS